MLSTHLSWIFRVEKDAVDHDMAVPTDIQFGKIIIIKKIYFLRILSYNNIKYLDWTKKKNRGQQRLPCNHANEHIRTGIIVITQRCTKLGTFPEPVIYSGLLNEAHMNSPTKTKWQKIGGSLVTSLPNRRPPRNPALP